MKCRKQNNQKHLQSDFIFNNLAAGLQLAKHEILQIFIIVYLFYKASRRPATLLKRNPTQVFSCEYCKIFKNTFFIENLRWLLL